MLDDNIYHDIKQKLRLLVCKMLTNGNQQENYVRTYAM